MDDLNSFFTVQGFPMAHALSSISQYWLCVLYSGIMFHQSWNNAEQLLNTAKRWVFIGYSLPAADYEFKYLLKRIELARPKPPDVIVVTGGDGASTTRKNYRHFFGTRLNKHVFNDGLTDHAIAYVTT